MNPAEFSISGKELSELVSLSSEKPDMLMNMGGSKALVEKLRTHAKHGISGDEQDVANRKSFFGKNYVEEKAPASFFELCWGALQDFTLIMLMCSALLSIILGMSLEVCFYFRFFNSLFLWDLIIHQSLVPLKKLIKSVETGWFEGTAILVTVLIVVFVTASNDYFKEKQFSALNAQSKDITIDVQRNNNVQKVSVYDLVVGDICYIQVSHLICF